MHILIIYQHYLAKGEPGFSRLNDYSCKWIQDGHKVTVVTAQVNYMTGKKNVTQPHCLIKCTLEDTGVKVIRAYIPSSYHKSVSKKIVALCVFAMSSILATHFAERPDVILVSSPPLFMVVPALYLSTIRQVPYVLDIRDLWPESGYTLGVLRKGSLSGKILSFLERLAISKARVVNVLSPAFREDIILRKISPSEKIKVIPNGVDFRKLNFYENLNDIRKELGWEGRFVTLYTGAHGFANQLEQLIDAAEILREEPEILIACVGDGICLSELRRKAEKRALNNIRFYGPFPKEMAIKLVAVSDVCTAVLKRGGAFKKVYPNKVFEYMACNKPIILAIDGAARELVMQAKAGIFVPPENPVAFAKAVRFFQRNPAICKEMGANGRQYVMKYFDLNELYKQMTGLLESVCKASQT